MTFQNYTNYTRESYDRMTLKDRLNYLTYFPIKNYRLSNKLIVNKF